MAKNEKAKRKPMKIWRLSMAGEENTAMKKQ